MKYMKLIWGFVLFIATLDMQYGYYQFIRLASAIFFVYYAFFYFKDNKNVLGTLFTGLAILFQPFFKFKFDKPIWNTIDIVLGSFLIILYCIENDLIKKKKK